MASCRCHLSLLGVIIRVHWSMVVFPEGLDTVLRAFEGQQVPSKDCSGGFVLRECCGTVPQPILYQRPGGCAKRRHLPQSFDLCLFVLVYNYVGFHQPRTWIWARGLMRSVPKSFWADGTIPYLQILSARSREFVGNPSLRGVSRAFQPPPPKGSSKRAHDSVLARRLVTEIRNGEQSCSNLCL